MTRRYLPILALATSLLSAAQPAGATEGRWLHVRVEEAHGANVRVNLPLSLIDALIPMIPEEHLHADGSFVVFDRHRWTVDDLRNLWRQIEQSPDMTFVTVEDEGEHVRVSKSGGHLLIQVSDRRFDGDDEIDIKVPLGVVDALLAGDGDRLDLQAAVRALAQSGDGELASITGKRETVRIWIDDRAEAD